MDSARRLFARTRARPLADLDLDAGGARLSDKFTGIVEQGLEVVAPFEAKGLAEGGRGAERHLGGAFDTAGGHRTRVAAVGAVGRPAETPVDDDRVDQGPGARAPTIQTDAGAKTPSGFTMSP